MTQSNDTPIHATAIIGENVSLGENIRIAPYTVIDGNVTIADGCRIGPHVHITGNTTIGSNTHIHAGAVIGDEPQDLNFTPESDTYTQIGHDCVIREYVTIHRGTAEGSTTKIGNNVMLMGFAHVGHNCDIGDNVVVANSTLLSGYVEIAEHAFLSGGLLVHQFVRIGTRAMLGGGGRIPQDVPPYCMVVLGYVKGPNSVGLRRAKFSTGTRNSIRQAVRELYFNGNNRRTAVEKIQQDHAAVPEAVHIAEFVAGSKRGIMPGDENQAHQQDAGS